MAKSINCKCFLIPVNLQFKCLGEENKNVNHVIKRLDFTSRSFLAVSSLHACSSLLAYSSADILTTLQLYNLDLHISRHTYNLTIIQLRSSHLQAFNFFQFQGKLKNLLTFLHFLANSATHRYCAESKMNSFCVSAIFSGWCIEVKLPQLPTNLSKEFF